MTAAQLRAAKFEQRGIFTVSRVEEIMRDDYDAFLAGEFTSHSSSQILLEFRSRLTQTQYLVVIDDRKARVFGYAEELLLKVN